MISGGKKIPAEIEGKSIFFCRHVPELLIFPSKKMSLPTGYLKGKRVVAFAGIAYPDRFRNTLKQIGVEIVFFKSFPDHYWYKQKEIEELARYKEKRKADFLITTEKDWARIMDKNFDIGYIKIGFDIEDKEAFFRIIDERYKKNTNKSH